jgi:transcriptional regulator with XRE-family HTH domain
MSERRAPHGELSDMAGRTLRLARLRLDMTQDAMGEALGISGIEVYRKEKGQRPITRVQALAIECLLRRADAWPLAAPTA